MSKIENQNSGLKYKTLIIIVSIVIPLVVLVLFNITNIEMIFESFNTNIKLDSNFSTPYVFIVDRDLSLRGRDDDEDIGMLYGFNSQSVAEINNKMVDDVKIILAEYRLALKKNDSLFNE